MFTIYVLPNCVIHQGTQCANELEIRPLIIAADIVGLADAAFAEHGIQRFGVVVYIQPVADVLAFAIYGDRFAAQAF